MYCKNLHILREETLFGRTYGWKNIVSSIVVHKQLFVSKYVHWLMYPYRQMLYDDYTPISYNIHDKIQQSMTGKSLINRQYNIEGI